MKRPLFICLICCACGALLQSLREDFLLSAITSIIFGLACLFIQLKYRRKIQLVFFFSFLMGIASVLNQSAEQARIELKVPKDTDLLIQGVVIDKTLTSTGLQKLNVHTSELIYNNRTLAIEMKIQATLEESQFVQIGNNVTLLGALTELEAARNPGGYNEKNYLGAKKIRYKTHASLISQEEDFNIYAILGGIKSALSNTYSSILPQREAGIIDSMITGQRNGLDNYIKDLYRNNGIYHVLAISGIHLSITAMLAQFILSKFMHVNRAALLTIVFLIFYTCLTGASVSSVRATFMTSISILGILILKGTDIVTSASLAGIILILYEPLYLLDIGFQYSFIAVMGIGFFAEPLGLKMEITLDEDSGFFRYFAAAFTQSLAASLAAFFSTIPVQVYHFNYIVPWSVLSNIIIIPLLPIILALGFFAGILGFISINISILFSGALYYLLKIYENICLFFEKLPYSKILVATPHYILAIGFFVLLLLILRIYLGKYSMLKKNIYCLLSILIYWGIYTAPKLSPVAPTITIMDVGQGDCIVVENSDEVFVIDGGGWFGLDIGENTGVKVLGPYLDYKGIEKINAAFISHLDFDHATGIVELIAIKEVEKVYLPTSADLHSETYLHLKKLCEETGTKIIFMKQGDKISTERGIVFMALSPAQGGNYSDLNESGLVLYMDMGVSMLLTGDIGKNTEIALAQSYKEFNADILKLSHHGSKYSSAEEFLETLDPKIAIAGVGVNNRFGHPAPEVVERLRNRNIKFYSTNEDGAVIIEIRGQKPEIKTMLNKGE